MESATMATRKPFVGGNWKMNLNKDAAMALVEAVAAQVPTGIEVAVYPPFPYLDHVGSAIRTSDVILGAQDVYFEPDGAFTGEVSIDMLRDLGVQVVLVGHSERRHVLGENDGLINRKLRAVLNAGLDVTLCIGETLEQRDEGQTDAVNAAQIHYGLAGVPFDHMPRVTVAYEPVWAIGTGKTATPADAQAAHKFIRQSLAQMFTPAIADSTRIQYGGSVKPENAGSLFAECDIDGGLIGGASLNATDFQAIVDAAAKVVPANQS